MLRPPGVRNSDVLDWTAIMMGRFRELLSTQPTFSKASGHRPTSDISVQTDVTMIMKDGEPPPSLPPSPPINADSEVDFPGEMIRLTSQLKSYAYTPPKMTPSSISAGSWMNSRG